MRRFYNMSPIVRTAAPLHLLQFYLCIAKYIAHISKQMATPEARNSQINTQIIKSTKI